MSGHLLILNLAGGVALLLWATRMVRTGVMRAYGAELRRSLGRFTRNRLTALGIGVGISALLQSSTATALLAVSFASRGLLAVSAGLALMLGADIGSTLVVQLLSFDLAWASPLLILIGVASFMSSEAPLRRHLGRVAIGLGLLLLALALIVAASDPLRDSAALKVVLAPLAADPVLAVLLAALLTWLFHSSVAMVLLIMSLTLTGVLPLGLGFALVLGANVGSGLIPLALVFKSVPQARRIPLGNLLFRLLGALAVLPAIDFLMPLLAALDDDPARQIANFHTAFNLALAAVFLPLTGIMARLTERLCPAPAESEGEAAPKYLDSSAIGTPAVALACATREVLHLADKVETMLRGTIEVFRHDDTKLLGQLSKLDDEVDRLHLEIKLYLAKVSGDELDEEEGQRSVELVTFTTNLEHIGDIIDKNLLELAAKKARHKLSFSDEGWREIETLHGRVMAQMKLAMSVFVSGDPATARKLIAEKDRFRDLERLGSEQHFERLRSGVIETIETSALHLDILRDLKRINSHLTSVAYPILDERGELRSSRLKRRARDKVEASEAKVSFGPTLGRLS